MLYIGHTQKKPLKSLPFVVLDSFLASGILSSDILNTNKTDPRLNSGLSVGPNRPVMTILHHPY